MSLSIEQKKAVVSEVSEVFSSAQAAVLAEYRGLSVEQITELRTQARENGVGVTELSTHLQGQLVAVHPTYDAAFYGFAAPSVHGNPKARQEWAVDQVKMALSASKTWESAITCLSRAL